MVTLKANPKEIKFKVSIGLGKIDLAGILIVPEGAKGIVLFAHGSGSSHLSPRNHFVAGELNKAKLGTLLFDLFTPEEEYQDSFTGQFRFSIELLSQRLIAATNWVEKNSEIKDLPIGYFGASTGAAACLAAAAAAFPARVRAIVSRGGRPDLALKWLPNVKAPTILIVGGLDAQVIGMNQRAFDKLETEKELVIVPGASHLFEERGALERVATLAGGWFKRYLYEQ